MANLDKSLGELISSRKTASRGRGRTRRGGAARPPAGGVTKSTAKPAASTARGSAKTAATPTGPAATGARGGNKKILISGLPTDATEQHVKEFFSKVGQIAKVEMSYDQRGRSRGIVTVIFRQDVAQKAVTEFNGLEVDKKPIRVEVVYDANHLPPAQPTKSLSDRVAQPKKEAATKKDKPKKVEAAKKERDGTTAGAGKAGRVKRGRNAGRPKKKTAEELDAEMTDYFGSGGQAASGTSDAAAAPAAAAPAGDNTMDEVL